MIRERKAQVWVETVVYTLIGLTIIAIILAISIPSIERYKDKLIIQQTLSMMDDLDGKITNVRDDGAGNRRLIPELMLKKGKLEIKGDSDQINYIMERTRYQFSELGSTIQQGNMNITTQQIGRNKFYNINITLNYPNINITYGGKDSNKTLTAASVAYRFTVENKGTTTDAGVTRVWIDIEELS